MNTNQGLQGCHNPPWPSRLGTVAALFTAFTIQGALGAPANEAKDLQRRAQSGQVAAQYELGRRFEHGIGTEANSTVAVRWYRRAADQGHAAAQYSLGRLYADGDGVRRDSVQAVKWFSRAAAQGYALAQNRLGRAYEFGQGVPQDLVEACRWYLLAADTHPAARLNQHTLATRLTETQLAEAHSRASVPLTSAVNGR